jgi:hypothetical protein
MQRGAAQELNLRRLNRCYGRSRGVSTTPKPWRCRRFKRSLLFGRAPRSGRWFHAAKGREATVFVEYVESREAGPAHSVELVDDGARCVLRRDVGEHLVPVLGPFKGDEVLRIAPTHDLFNCRACRVHEVEDPEGASGPERGKDLRKYGIPFGVGSQVVQNSGGEYDV